jgi:hypothetical protein
MKIIEALKQIKELQRKAEDLRDKIKVNAAYSELVPLEYDSPKEKVKGWLQAHHDIVKKIEGLKLAIQATNLKTEVTISFENSTVTKSIAAWIHRRVMLADLEKKAWQGLTSKGIKLKDHYIDREGNAQTSILKLNYDPEERDAKVELYNNEASLIDSKLEIVNATTDLVE